MTEELYNTMNWADVEEITYSESTQPKRILGPHLLEEGLLIQAFLPTAKDIEVKIQGDRVYQMELADEQGFFAVLIPEKEEWHGEIPKYSFLITFDNDTTEETEDPYSFASIYTDEDLKRFNAGIHYEVYNKMGAHPVVIDGVEGVEFSVWAPNAQRVSVVGDFNLWDGRRNMMQKLGDSGVFELFIPRLKPGTLYKYEIKQLHKDPFLKIDPYAFGFELRPNTASIVRDIEDFTWTDQEWQEKKLTAKPKEEPMSVYEVHLGSFIRKQPLINEDGTAVNGSEFYNYREIAKKLAEYVHKMGYTHIEIMPVMEHPLDESWGYQVSGYYAPTARYGTAEDFMYFMNYMHEQGIGVILDWVPAHFPRDSWGLAQYDGTALYESADPERASHPHWGTLIFNYARYEASNFLIANAMFWADKYHADGIRMDAVASMLYLDYGRQGGNAPRNMYGGNENLDAVEFLKHLNSQFHKKFPGTLLIAEESTAWPNITGSVEDGGLGFDLKWNMGWMNDFLSYMQCDPFFRKNNYNQLTFSMIYNYSEDFQLVFSHDEVVHGKRSMLGKMPGKTFEEKARNLRAAYGYFWTHPGKKLLFMAQDFAQYDEWSESQEIEWNLLEYPVHKDTQSFVKDLNEVYRSHPALWKLDYYPDGFEWINCSYRDLSLVMFVRKTDKPEETILVVSNFDNIAHPKFRVGVPFCCTAKALISSDDKKYGGFGMVHKVAHKAEKMEWDDREYSVEIDIPSMSTTIYQLTPATPEPERKKKAAQKSEAVKAEDTVVEGPTGEDTAAKVKKPAARKSTAKRSIAGKSTSKASAKEKASAAKTRSASSQTIGKTAKAKTTKKAAAVTKRRKG
ncbi:1,4-alpha-glucan branching protein GlgB [Oribacterium sp. HCP28S3_H8]|uniref:1,4-alpha-glucan branching protein GlgB n=1 Tax=Oribacterium sp. HCP28S3_H8 TaxID=3438945 RepID=UPI003F8A8A65